MILFYFFYLFLLCQQGFFLFESPEFEPRWNRVEIRFQLKAAMLKSPTFLFKHGDKHCMFICRLSDNLMTNS